MNEENVSDREEVSEHSRGQKVGMLARERENGGAGAVHHGMARWFFQNKRMETNTLPFIVSSLIQSLPFVLLINWIVYTLVPK